MGATMDNRWNREWRKDYDAQARQLWLDMEQRVWRDARIFSGLEPSPTEPDASDDIDVLNDEELDDIGELGDGDPPLPSARRPFGISNKHKCG
jgi:hypothetical protein